MRHRVGLAVAVVLSGVAGCSSRPADAGFSGTGTGGQLNVAGVAGTAGAAGSAGVGVSEASAAIGGAGGTVSGAGAGASTAGNAGTASDPNAIPATFKTVKLVLGGGGGIMPCSAAPCHGVNGMAPPKDPLELPPMDDDQLYENLLSYVSRACNNTKLVTPGQAAQSALLTILTGPCGKTPRMPFGCTEGDDCIPTEYITAVKLWIEAGAPR